MLFGGLTSRDEDRNLSREATHVTLPRKASSESATTRTAKPTQVVEERILR